jgi:hypothetical protein
MPLRGALEGFFTARKQMDDEEGADLQRAAALQTLLGTVQKQRRAQAYEQEMAGLPSAATEEQRNSIAMRYASPDVVAKANEAALTRKAASDQAAAQFAMTYGQKQDALNQAKELALQRAADKKEQDSINNQFKERQQALDAETKMWQRYFSQQGVDIKNMQLQAVKDKQDATKAQQLQTQTQKLGKSLEQAGLTEGDATLAQVEDALKKDPSIAEYITGPKSLLPDRLVSSEVRDARQAFQKLFNITLKMRSGAAVTEQELSRLKQEFGVGIAKDPEQIGRAIDQARNIQKKHYGAIVGGYGPDVLKAYNDNLEQIGGRVVLRPQGGAPAAPPAPAASASAQTGPAKISGDAEYDALPSGAVFIGPDGKQRKKP